IRRRMSVMELNVQISPNRQMVSAATSRARKLPPRGRVKDNVKERCRGCPGESVFFVDCACFARDRLKSDLAKAISRSLALACVMMASRVQRDLPNMVSPERKPCSDNQRKPFGCILLLKV